MTWQQVFNAAYIILGVAFASQAIFIATRYVRYRERYPTHWKHVALAGLGGFLIGLGTAINALLAMTSVPVARPITLAGLLSMNVAMSLLYTNGESPQAEVTAAEVTAAEVTAAELLLENKLAAQALLDDNARIAASLLEANRRLAKEMNGE
jgi:hypothetical protein